MLGNHMVETFCNTVVFGRVVDCQPLCHAVIFEECNKLLPGVLATSVRVQDLDCHVVLGLVPRGELLVSAKCLVLLVQKVNMRKMAVVICVGDPVSAAMPCCDGGGTPEIRVHLITKCFRTFPIASLWDRLARSLGIHARLVE